MDKRCIRGPSRYRTETVENFQITLKTCRDCLRFSYRKPGQEGWSPADVVAGPQVEVWLLIWSMVWG